VRALRLTERGQLTGHYHLRLPVRRGDIRLGRVGTVQLNGGTVTLSISRESDETIQISAGVTVTIGGGTLEPIPGSRVSLGAGSRLEAQSLSVTQTNGVTGLFSSANLVVGPSVIRIPGGFILETKDGGRLTATQTSNPLTVPQAGSFVEGSFVLDLPFSNFYNAQDASLQLKGGTVRLPLQVRSDGQINGSGCSVGGTLTMRFSSPPNPPFDIPISINMSDGVLNRTPGSSTTFTAKVDSVIPAGVSIPIRTKAEDQEGDQYLFAVDLAIKTAGDTALSGTVTFDGTRVSLPPMSQVVPLAVEVMAGNGEHEDGDPNNTNGNNAPMQEIFTDTFSCPFGCRLHVYLIPHTYAVTANIHVGLSPTGPDIRIGELRFSEGIRWDRDGCGVCIALASIWQFITGGDSPNAMAEQKITEKINSFEYTLPRSSNPPAVP
jgi:hypothetical protein